MCRDICCMFFPSSRYLHFFISLRSWLSSEGIKHTPNLETPNKPFQGLKWGFIWNLIWSKRGWVLIPSCASVVMNLELRGFMHLCCTSLEVSCDFDKIPNEYEQRHKSFLRVWILFIIVSCRLFTCKCFFSIVHLLKLVSSAGALAMFTF